MRKTASSSYAAWLHCRGFTMVELVVTIVIVGILAVAVIPRFIGQAAFDARGFADATQAMLRYGQKVAIAQHREVYAVLAGSQLSLCYDAACSAQVQKPAEQAPFTQAAPSGVALASSAASFHFDALGRPNPDAAVTVTITAAGEPTRTIIVERETGYVHQ